MENKETGQLNKLTAEPVGKLLVSLSIPTIISMLVTTLYNIADTAFVGTLGTSQSGATGVVNGFMAILQAFAFMCGQGAGSIMSRKLGAKNQDEADKYASTGFAFSFIIGLVISIVSFIFINPLMRMLGATPTIAPYARTYTLWILIAAPFFTSSFTTNNLLRYEGKAKLGTVAMMTGAVLNIFGDAILIVGLKLGIAGAGISTCVSQLISFIIIVSMYLNGKTNVKMSIRKVSKCINDYVEIATTGFPALLRQGLNSIATMLLNRLASVYGDQAVAAMSIVGRLGFFPMAIAIGIGQGFQPISAFNYGAGIKRRVKEAFKKGLFGSVMMLFIAGVPTYIFAPELVGFMRNDPDVILIGTRALRLLCIAQMSIPLSMMIEMGFQSTGQKMLASVSSSLRSGIIFIPVLWVMAKTRGLSGIQEAQPLSFVITFFICLYFLKVYLRELND